MSRHLEVHCRRDCWSFCQYATSHSVIVATRRNRRNYMFLLAVDQRNRRRPRTDFCGLRAKTQQMYAYGNPRPPSHSLEGMTSSSTDSAKRWSIFGSLKRHLGFAGSCSILKRNCLRGFPSTRARVRIVILTLIVVVFCRKPDFPHSHRLVSY